LPRSWGRLEPTSATVIGTTRVARHGATGVSWPDGSRPAIVSDHIMSARGFLAPSDRLSALLPRLYPVWQLAAATGMRRGELMALT